jgi:hypothetical protein
MQKREKGEREREGEGEEAEKGVEREERRYRDYIRCPLPPVRSQRTSYCDA